MLPQLSSNGKDPCGRSFWQAREVSSLGQHSPAHVLATPLSEAHYIPHQPRGAKAEVMLGEETAILVERRLYSFTRITHLF